MPSTQAHGEACRPEAGQAYLCKLLTCFSAYRSLAAWNVQLFPLSLFHRTLARSWLVLELFNNVVSNTNNVNVSGCRNKGELEMPETHFFRYASSTANPVAQICCFSCVYVLIKSTYCSLRCQNKDYIDHDMKWNNHNDNNNNNKNNKLRNLEQATTLLTCFEEGIPSNVARNTKCFEAFSGFAQFLQTYSGTILQVDPLAFPFTLLLIHFYSSQSTNAPFS